MRVRVRVVSGELGEPPQSLSPLVMRPHAGYNKSQVLAGAPLVPLVPQVGLA